MAAASAGAMVKPFVLLVEEYPMLVTRAAIGIVFASFLHSAPALAADDCNKANENDQAECWWNQADALSDDLLETMIDKCKKLYQKENDQAWCAAFGMAALIKEVENIKPKR